MRGRMPARLRILCVLGSVAAVAAAQPALAQVPYGYAQPESPAAALARHVRTLAAEPQGLRRFGRGGQSRARPWRRPGRGRLFRPCRRGQSAQSIAAGGDGRSVGRQWRSRRPRCLISPALMQLGAPAATRSPAIAVWPMICWASRPRPRPITAPRSTAPTRTKRGAGSRSASRSAATRPARSRR